MKRKGKRKGERERERVTLLPGTSRAVPRKQESHAQKGAAGFVLLSQKGLWFRLLCL